MTTYESGSVIAGYRIDSLIGRGGMAVVYRAEDMRLGRKVALKLLTPQLADNEQFRQRFVQESRLAASLDHPNIVPIYEAGEADGQLYIAMRYVVGPDLKGLLAAQGGTLPLEWAPGLFGQIGDALDAAHRAGLVHRDVKPANILVAESQERPGDAGGYHVYLTDFGLTKRTSELSGGLTGTGHFLGTVDYVSPEQIQGKAVGPGADIYALGCVLYESLTGLPPFRRDDDAALLWAHLVETPPSVTVIRPEVPEAVSAVVARAMAKDPADRYGSAEELVYELESALDVPARGTAPVGRRIPDSGAAEHVTGGSRHTFVRFPAPPDAVHEPAPSADHPEREPEHDDDGSAADRREPETHSAPLAVAGDGSRVVAAVAAAPSGSAEGPRPRRSVRRRRVVRLVIVGLLALVLDAAAVGANVLDPVDATSVVAEPADSAGEDPFTPPPTPGGAASGPIPPAGDGPAPGIDDGAPPEDVRVSGDTGGLYGGTGTDACSASSMTEFFDDHPDRAAAWAGAQGIEPSDIRSFLNSLTPVVLRSDTAVTNHGFRDGRANAYLAVLQAGTAVMVDEYGVPRVRCACGNPLDGPGALDQVSFTGETWSELGHRPVTVVEPAPAVVEHFVVLVVQEDTTAVVDRPAGTDGDHDEPAPEVPEAARESSADDPADAESGDAAVAGGAGGSGEAPAAEGSTGTPDPAAADGTGAGGEPAADGAAGSGVEPPPDGSTAPGAQPATDGSTGAGEEPAADGSTTGQEATDGSAASGGEPAADGATAGQEATDGSAGSGEEPPPDGSTGTGGQAATDGSSASGEEPAPDGSTEAAGLPATDGSTGTGTEAATGEPAGSGGG